jgi:hypothetical protein
MLPRYILLLKRTSGRGKLLALCICAIIVACCIPREIFPREFLQVPEFGSFQSEVTSRLKNCFRCSDRCVRFGVDFIKNKPRTPLGRKPLGDTNRVCQSSLVPITGRNGTCRGLRRLC